jgi:hypothetical protein
MDLDLPIISLSVLALCAPSASARNSFAVPNVRELRDAELQVCPQDEFVVKTVQRDLLWRQRFVESGVELVSPVWSMVQYHESPEVGVAYVGCISTNIDPTNRIEVYVLKRTRTWTTNASECFELFQFTPSKNGESLWWTIHMDSRRVSHIVKKEGPVCQEIIVHFHSESCDFETKEKLLHVFSFENKRDRQQYPSEIQTVRDTMKLDWLVNLNTSPVLMLRTLCPALFNTTRDGKGILALRRSSFFRDLNDFHERNKFFPPGKANRGSIQAHVTFGPSPPAPAAKVRDSPPAPAATVRDLEVALGGLHICQTRADGSFAYHFSGTATSPHTVQLADGRKAKFCLVGNKETPLSVIEYTCLQWSCDGRPRGYPKTEITLQNVITAALGGQDGKGTSAGDGGLNLPEIVCLLSLFRVLPTYTTRSGELKCMLERQELICMLRELLISLGIISMSYHGYLSRSDDW